MGKASEIRVSPAGMVTTIVFESGNVKKMRFNDFLRKLEDWQKAVYKYALTVWDIANNEAIAYKAVSEIYSKLLGADKVE